MPGSGHVMGENQQVGENWRMTKLHENGIKKKSKPGHNIPYYIDRYFSLPGRSLLERCSAADTDGEEAEKFCSRFLALGILQPFNDCLRKPITGSDAVEKPGFNVRFPLFILFP